VLAACTPQIGDKCVLSTDCSTRGDRLCDTSQPEGYCTQFNCSKNSCPNEAACVLFNAAVPGCGYDDRAGQYGSRVARSFCAAQCSDNSDCRAGYVCEVPTSAPWNGLILDDDQAKRTCVVAVDAVGDAGLFTPKAPICSATTPEPKPIEAGAPRIEDGGGPIPPLVDEGGVVDAGTDSGSDGGDGGDGG
jgi:hypothetical protein